MHGFTSRKGGVSEGSFASLNVSAKRGDKAAKVEENLRRIAEAGGFGRDLLRRVHQVHGRAVISAAALEADSQADAMWTHVDEGPRVVSVTTADCVPILLGDGSFAAAIHSGWRGTVADIVGATVQVLDEAGCDRSTLRAAIGPCIYVDAFEVGEEVAEHFSNDFVLREGFDKPHVDLLSMIRQQLLETGLHADSIDVVGACTHANPDRFFSYRRDGAKTGQALSFAGFSGQRLGTSS